MKRYKKGSAALVVMVTAFMLICGMNCEMETRKVYAAQIEDMKVYNGEMASADILQEIPQSALEATYEKVTRAKKAYEKKQEEEAKRKEEEERLAREEAERLAREETERQAEEVRRQAEELAAQQQAEEERQQALAAQQQVQQAEEVSGDEQILLAALIFCEAGNQPYEGQVAVGAVVMNRVRSSVYPNSIREVIYQPGQFGPAMTGWLNTVLANGNYTNTALQAAADALAGSNPVGDCLYFGCGNYGIQIGDHFFH